MKKNMLLDIDDELLSKKFMLHGNAKSDEDEALSKQSESPPFFVIQPTPGACIKTQNDRGEKIFINICITGKIPPPEDISDTKLFELLSEETPSFSIPMSIGTGHLEVDKAGSPCMAYDVAINSTYFEKCQQKKHFWLLTISVIMDGISHKTDQNLNTEEYTVLKNRKVMGKLQQHRIENREPRKQIQKPLIEELSLEDSHENRSKADSLTRNSCVGITGNSKLDYVLLRQPPEGNPSRLIGLFHMPEDITNKDVAVLLDPDRIIITSDKTGLTYDVCIPYVVNTESATSFLDKDIRVLKVDMEVSSTVS